MADSLGDRMKRYEKLQKSRSLLPMRHIPKDLLRRILALPDGQQLRLVVNTNGHGDWKIEAILFGGACNQQDMVDLSLSLQEDNKSWIIKKTDVTLFAEPCNKQDLVDLSLVLQGEEHQV